MTAPLAVVVLAAGKGTRMKSDLPKVLHPVAGRPMIDWVLAAAAPLEPREIVVVVGPDMPGVAAAVAPHRTAVQAEQLGTADAVGAARAALADALAAGADVLVLYGDGPLIEAGTLKRMAEAREREAADYVWLGFRPADPTGYGRLVPDDGGDLERIVEEKDCSEAERRIGLCWGGLLLARGAALFAQLPRIGNDNAKGEYYLTALVELAAAAGERSIVVECSAEEVVGVNSRAELAGAEALLQARLRAKAMAEGATLIDPATVYLSWDTRLGRDVTVQPGVFFGPGVEVGDRVEIRAFSHLEGCRIESGAVVGPFARLRPGAELGEGARVGNFVEVKAATLGAGAKVNHLSYVGDATVGSHANVGAGTITCNYDGFRKSRTEIGAGAFIGSNTALVAPVTVGAGAIVGAGSTIAEDVPDEALAVTRAEQKIRPLAARRFREKRAKDKKKE
ncbi:bifunctional UDP-N-acetylglucosamine pyrophosphorylase / Glucosamine-1-phosphate N-acetyltransferase [Tistlia consotensis]|uniref:Bifunctional protein GlmU n=1 Tax=Tistlia consotensis USBA 355 TaxID=560819 RepID=A0A1Y6CRC1_9PROT|nr:bifunctional UDP-N-acetylglucosamine diphosphorylase/glucosamine-1-phosphate N-acetyltransferase GlmU [Tistlia consotensis]SMF67338.1 UDP-N-acetylglucosamine pyrophosphorylase /glucosamine-1-phosphate N-acetyltransferase [Tistlia consotensis USBA 355]SNR99964.1 bifunctional UDP-N-acetylglucosamine pyrophosphorylase / Glucosamine-1-phosphate N-acetyltransferase [Tistlia consotensis]